MTSLRSRSSAFVAYFLSVFLGATVIGAFGTLLETAAGDVSATDRETLVTMGTVVGSWGLVIVLFSVASTLTLTARQRSGELALLRTIGATPRQNRRMILTESMVVTAAASLLAAAPAWLAGAGVFALLQNADMLSDSIDHRTGVTSIGFTSLGMVLVSGLAVVVATRRAARMSVTAAQADSVTGPARMSRWRIVAGVLFLAAGLSYSLLTVTVMADSDDPFAAMSTAGPASVFWSMGFATLAPALLRTAAAPVGVVLRRLGAAGYLAAYDSRARSHLLAGALSPVIVFVGIGTGTTYLVAIENAAAGAAGSAEARNVELLNYVVVGMITVFAAIMVVNTLAAAISARRRELGQQRLAGATPEQVRAAMLLEGALVAATGIVWGGLASLGTVLPYSSVKLDRVLPGLGAGYFLGVAVAALAVTLGSTYVSTRRALRPTAVEAVALSAA